MHRATEDLEQTNCRRVGKHSQCVIVNKHTHTHFYIHPHTYMHIYIFGCSLAKRGIVNGKQKIIEGGKEGKNL